jgi:uncharacterized protein (TIGR02996 family)
MARHRKTPVNDELEAAVRASFDDAPRLRYADWFEANGQPGRAELIRVQVRRDRELPIEPERTALENRERELRGLGEPWLAQLPLGLEGVRWELLRGFPSRVIFDSYQAFEKHHARAFASAPVEAVCFRAIRAVGRLAASPALAQIRRLELRGTNIRDAGAAALAASPYLANLTHLYLDGNEITDAGIEALAASPHLGNVTHLELGIHPRRPSFGDAGALALARSASLRNVIVLGLAGSKIGHQGLRALLTAPGWQKLVWLNLSNCSLGPEGLAPLAEGRSVPELRGLVLGGNPIADEGACHLAGAAQLTSLRCLNFRGCWIGNRGTVALAGAAHLAELRQVDLVNNQVGEEGAVALARSPYLGSLVDLELANNLVGAEGARALAASTTLRSLRQINLYNNGIGDAFVRAVSERFLHDDPSRIPSELLAPVKPAPLPDVAPREQYAGARDEQGLLAAIADVPDDELLRQAYADWLEESGHAERAALLRLACDEELPGMTPAEVRALRQQREALTEPLLKGWLAPVIRAGAKVRFPGGLPRAFVNMRTFLTRKFQETMPDWLRSDRVWELSLTGTTINWKQVADCPLLAGLGSLSLADSRFDHRWLGDFLASPHLAGLHTLHFEHGSMAHYLTRVLAEAATLSRLRRLRIKVTFFLKADLGALAGWPQLATVRGIDLSDCFLDGQEVHTLLYSPHLVRLTHLRLRHNRLADTGATAIANNPGMAHLSHLDLTMNNVTDRGAATLAASPHLRNLIDLRLGSNALTDEGARHLAGSPSLDKLRWLVLTAGRLTEAGVRALRDRFGERFVLR